jgi:hypothetical protein
MLKLREIISERPVSIQVDEYVPLRIKFEPSVISIDEAFYWRSTNSNYLLELEVHASDGALADVGVVLVPDERVIRAGPLQKLYGTRGVKKGLPRIDTAPWKDKIGPKEIGIEPRLRRKDEAFPFKYFIAVDGVAVLLDGGSPAYTVQNGPVDFVFDANDELCGLGVRDSKVGRDANRLVRSRVKD